MSFQDYYYTHVKQMKERVIKMLSYVGEKAVNEVRINGTYTDRTRNLRGSTGYVIVDNGEIVKSGDFQPVPGGPKTGPDNAKAFTEELAKQFPRGLVLILVAGMEYAAYVQDKGYDVISSGEDLVNREVPRLLKKLGI